MKQDLNDTKALLDDSSSIISTSAINKKFDNTQFLLEDKTLIDEKEIKQPNEDHSQNVNAFLSRSIDDIMSLSNTNIESLNKSEGISSKNDNRITPEIEYSFSKLINFGMLFPTEEKVEKIKVKNSSANIAQIEFKISDRGNLKEFFPNYVEICDNSNIEYNCLVLMNKAQKINLVQGEEVEVILKIKTPFVKKRQNLFFLLEVYNNNFLDKSIPIVSTIEIPKFCCLKNVAGSKNNSTPLIPIKIELKSKGQKYRIPFRNYSLKDIKLNFVINNAKSKGKDYYISSDNKIYKFMFIFFPNELIVTPQTTVYVDMIIKVSLEKENNENLIKNKNNKIRKVINANISDTEISYFLLVDGYIEEN